MSALGVAALVAGILVLAPSLVLASECLAACLPGRRPRRAPVRVPSVAVVVHADEDEARITGVVRALAAELGADDRVVVACPARGRTAMLARALGADVVPAPEARDRGTALRAVLEHLSSDPPDVVLIGAMDLRFEPGTIRALALAAALRGAAVRCVPVADHGRARTALGRLLAERVRPLGRARLGVPHPADLPGTAHLFAALRDAMRQADAGATVADPAAVTVTGVGARGPAPDPRELRAHARRLLASARPGAAARAALLALDLLVPEPVALGVAWSGALALATVAVLVDGDALGLRLVLGSAGALGACVGAAWAVHGAGRVEDRPTPAARTAPSRSLAADDALDA